MKSKTNTLKKPNKVNDNSILIGEPDLLYNILTLLCVGLLLTLLTVYTYFPKSVDTNSCSVITNITNNTTNFSNDRYMCLSLIIINWLYLGLYIYLMMLYI